MIVILGTVVGKRFGGGNAMEVDEAPGGDLSLVTNCPELGRQLQAGRQDHSSRLSRGPGWQVPLPFST